MTEYNFIYKCRRCGGYDNSLSCGDKNKCVQHLVNAAIGIHAVEPMAPGILSVHFCPDGGGGVSDLLGFSQVVV